MTTPEFNVCANPLCDTAPLKDRDGKVMDPPMTLALVRKFARRTRNYERIYDRFPTPEAMVSATEESGCSGFELMEKLYKICSVTAGAHRSTFDQEQGLLGRVERNDSSAFAEDSAHVHTECVGVVDRCEVDIRVEQCFTMMT